MILVQMKEYQNQTDLYKNMNNVSEWRHKLFIQLGKFFNEYENF